MTHKHTDDFVRVNYQETKFGDVINIRAPFEENTPEYYNGHDVLDVRGEYVQDSKGNRGKWRPVMVIDVTPTELIYIPLTTSVGSLHDEYYQYHVKDNSMTPQNPNHPHRETFAEIGSVRRLPIKPYHKAQFYGTLAEEDIDNIKQALDANGLNVTDGLDKYKYVTPEKRDLMRSTFEKAGYEITEIQDGLVYKQENREFTVYDSGVVHYHFELPLEVVRRRTEMTEKRRLPVRDDFVSEVSKLDKELGEQLQV